MFNHNGKRFGIGRCVDTMCYESCSSVAFPVSPF